MTEALEVGRYHTRVVAAHTQGGTMILIITSKQDGHIGSVTQHLDAADQLWVRINTEDFATNVELSVSPVLGTGRLFLRDSGKTVDLTAVRAVWYRKPEPTDLSHLELTPAAAEYVEAEFTEILHGLYALLNHVPWINDPFTTRIAHRKLLQLRVASQVGFRTPQSLVTNQANFAQKFAHGLAGDIAIKSLGALCVTENETDQVLQYGIFTRRISQGELADFADKVRHMPTLFQEFVVKRHELRITCVGEQVFSCLIEPRHGDITSDDYRFDTNSLMHSSCNCPDLHERMHAYMKRFGLNFGCFDFATPAAGEPVFLECNPNGQWLWVENLTGMPIGKAIANELLTACRGKRNGDVISQQHETEGGD